MSRRPKFCAQPSRLIVATECSELPAAKSNELSVHQGARCIPRRHVDEHRDSAGNLRIASPTVISLNEKRPRTRSDQGKKTQRRRCGKTIETECSEGDLRSDPNHSRTRWAWLGKSTRKECHSG